MSLPPPIEFEPGLPPPPSGPSDLALPPPPDAFPEPGLPEPQGSSGPGLPSAPEPVIQDDPQPTYGSPSQAESATPIPDLPPDANEQPSYEFQTAKTPKWHKFWKPKIEKHFVVIYRSSFFISCVYFIMIVSQALSFPPKAYCSRLDCPYELQPSLSEYSILVMSFLVFFICLPFVIFMILAPGAWMDPKKVNRVKTGTFLTLFFILDGFILLISPIPERSFVLPLDSVVDYSINFYTADTDSLKIEFINTTVDSEKYKTSKEYMFAAVIVDDLGTELYNMSSIAQVHTRTLETGKLIQRNALADNLVNITVTKLKDKTIYLFLVQPTIVDSGDVYPGNTIFDLAEKVSYEKVVETGSKRVSKPKNFGPGGDYPGELDVRAFRVCKWNSELQICETLF